MRVISGSAKGRRLKPVPGTGTRPTADKVKEAVFSMIGPYFDGGTVLDLFAGTGALGIESLSRGMEKGIFIDRDPVSVRVVRENLAATALSDRAEVYRSDAQKAVKLLARRRMLFDLVFLDPPYRMRDMDAMIERLREAGLLAPRATVVVEHDAAHEYPHRVAGLAAVRRSVYGDTAVTIYKLAEEMADADGEVEDEVDEDEAQIECEVKVKAEAEGEEAKVEAESKVDDEAEAETEAKVCVETKIDVVYGEEDRIPTARKKMDL